MAVNYSLPNCDCKIVLSVNDILELIWINLFCYTQRWIVAFQRSVLFKILSDLLKTS